MGIPKLRKKVVIYDSTLQDGAQAEGISFTVNDKLKIVQRLDEFGIDYIEAGNPDPTPRIWSSLKRSAGCD